MTCELPEGPACVDPVLAGTQGLLATVTPGDLKGVERSALRCPRSIVLATGTYIQRRAAERAVGRRQARAGVKALRRISKSCDGVSVALST
jgi:hypothetical protein